MFRSMQKTGQVVLAVAAGFVLSFGATQAFASPEATPLMNDCAFRCQVECEELGGTYGMCMHDGSCNCYFW